jgi:Arc/MetJ-type ribon-helix-helix transcriptional regulator
MVRTQIQLTDEQARRLRRLAADRGVSMAALVRDGVERVLAEQDREELWGRALSVVGKYRDREGARDVAENHDGYLEAGYLDWRR